MDDNRKIRRRELVFQLKLIEAESGETFGWVVDIHPEGLKISGSDRLEAGTHYQLLIELPYEILGRTTVEFAAEILWCKPDINPSLYATGMQFVKIQQDDLESLIGLLTQHSMSD